jgi:regulator of sigma E protease
MVVVYILIFILVLGLVVCFHELGHYFWAKKNGILVNEFAFGMGPKIVSKKKGETYWSIRAFPIGGFCAMAGEEVGAPLLSEGDQVKLVFDDKGHVSKIVMTLDLEQYKDIEITIKRTYNV